MRDSWQSLSEVRCPMKILLERAVTAGLLQIEIMAAQSAKVTRSPLQQTEGVASPVGPSHGSLPTSLRPVAGRVTEHLPQMRPLPSRFESCFLIGSSLRLLCVYIQPIRAHLCIHTVNQGSSGSVYQVAQRRFTVQVAKGGGEAVKVLWEGRRHKTSWTGMRDGSAVKTISSST